MTKTMEDEFSQLPALVSALQRLFYFFGLSHFVFQLFLFHAVDTQLVLEGVSYCSWVCTLSWAGILSVDSAVMFKTQLEPFSKYLT